MYLIFGRLRSISMEKSHFPDLFPYVRGKLVYISLLESQLGVEVDLKVTVKIEKQHSLSLGQGSIT